MPIPPPQTSIGTPGSNIDETKMRGRDTLSDLVGVKSFSETFYMMVTGRDLEPRYTKLFDACLIILMDHGLTPGALVSRMVHDAMPDDIQVSMAAGMLLVGGKYAGTMAGAGKIFTKRSDFDGSDEEWAKATAHEFLSNKRPLPGYGHRHYKVSDPRADRMFELARECGVKGDYLKLAKDLEAAIEDIRGKRLVINATGALGAVLAELDFPVEAMRAVAALGRAAGVTGHVMEESGSPLTPHLFQFGNSVPYSDPE